MSASRPYHHGDLRRALLAAAIDAIAERGPAALSLRAVARRVGVSHAAPTHHFGDKTGLLTAIAEESFRLLAAELRVAWEQSGSFLEVGVAYMRFALTHPAHFQVMFRPDLHRGDDPALQAARADARRMLYGPIPSVAGDGDGHDRRRAGIAAWSLVHGLATLWLGGNLPPDLRDDPENLTRAVAAYLYGYPGGRENAVPQG